MQATMGTRAMSAVLGAALSAAVLAAVAPPASATTPACGGLIANGLSVDATHATTLFTDLGKGLDASYVGYKVTNSGSARTNLWVKLTGFTGSSVSLADATDDQRQIVSLPAGQSGTTFFFVKAASIAATAQGHTVTVWDRRPDLVGATSLAQCTFSFASVSDTTEASANKVTSVTAAPLSLAIGQTVTVTVDGQTGTVGNGMMWMSPAAKSVWPTKSLRLETTHLDVDKDGNGTYDEAYDQTLSIPASIASTYTSSTKYRATYTFRLTKATATNPTVQPVSQIYSGGQYKHSPLDSATTLSSSSVASGVVLTKTMTAADIATLPTTTAPNGVSGPTTYVEVPFRVRATAVGGSAAIDEIVDVPASGVVFKNGSARLNDATPFTNAAIANPVTAAGDTGVRAGALHFTGPFYASVSTPAQIDYVVYIPVTAGTYSNQGFATINGVTVGSTPTTVPIVNVTTNGSGVSGTTTATTGAGTSTQTITFAQPSGMTLLAGTQTASVTASSGVAVTLTSTTASVCSVSGTTITSVGVGTCSITATQIGDSTYAAAATVTRTFTVSKAAQSITFTEPSGMTLLGSTQTVSASASSGLAVALVSDSMSVCTVSGTMITSVGAGTCSITASQAGDSTYLAASSVTRIFAVAKAAQSIAFAALPDVTLGAAASDLVASSSSGLAVTFISGTPGVCTVAASSVTAIGGGTCTVTASQDGSSTYAVAIAVSRSFTVVLPGSTPQTVTFAQPADISMGGHQSLTASASSGLTVRLASTTPSVCSVAGTTVTAVAAGDCTVVATQSGNITYAAATPVSRTFAVPRAAQSISFTTVSSLLMTAGGAALEAAATSGLGVSFASSTPDVCTVSGGSLVLVGAGTCTVVATQPGDDNWSAATSVSRDIAVSRAPQSVVLAQPADMHLLDADQAVDVSAWSGLPVTLTSLTTDVCSVVAGAAHVLATGTCTLRASQGGDATWQPASVEASLAVAKATQSIDAASAHDLVLPGGAEGLSATASSGLEVSWQSLSPSICTVSGSAVTAAGAGTCQLEASQPGDATYAAASPVVVSLGVSLGTQAITWELPATALVADGPLTLEATASSDLPVVYVVLTPDLCTVDHGALALLAAGTCQVRADQSGSAEYAAAEPVTHAVEISLMAQHVEAETPDDVVVTADAVDLHASSDAGLAPVWVSDTPTVCVVDGATVAPIAAGTCILTASQPGDATFAAADPVQVSFQVMKASQTISVEPVATQVATGADVVVTATAAPGLVVGLTSSSPEVCAVVDGDGDVDVLTAGTCLLVASQAGSNRYEPAPDVAFSFEVQLAPQTVTLTVPEQLVVTDAPGDLTATSDAGLDVDLSSTTPDVCEVVGTTVHPLAVGTCHLVASSGANAVYAAAPDAGADVEVTRAPQSIDFAQPAGMTAADSDLALVATSGSGLAVTFSAAPGDVCTVVDGALHSVAAGSCDVTATQSGSDRYLAAAEVLRTVEIALAQQSIAFTASTTALLTESPLSITATATSGLGVTPTSATPLTCEVVDGTVELLAAGTCRLVATQSGDTRYAAADAVLRDVVVSRAPQTIAFGLPLGAVMAESPLALSATSDDGLAVTYASGTPTVCSVVEGGLVLRSTGDCIVTASQPGDSRYLPAEPVTLTVKVRSLEQTLAIDAIDDLDADQGPVVVHAASSRALAVAVSSETPDVCTVVDGRAELLAAGTCTIVANQPGTPSVAPAEPVRTSFSVRALPQTIHATRPADVTMVDAPQPFAASATSSLAVTVDVLAPEVCALEEGRVTALASGTCRIRVEQPGAGWYAAADPVTVAFSIALAPQSVGAQHLADVVMTDADRDVVPSATSGLVASVSSLTTDVCTVEGVTVHAVAVGTCELAVDQSGDARYAAAQRSTIAFTIAKAQQSVASEPHADVVLGDADGTVAATATSGLAPIVSSLTTDVCTIDGRTVHAVATGTCELAVDQAGDDRYAAAARVTVSFDVLPPLAADDPEIGQLDLETAVDAVVPVSGGVAPYRFAVTSGDLPDGLVLDPETGTISGTAVVPGAYELTVLVTDADGHTTELPLVLRVMGGSTPAQLPALHDLAVTTTAGTTTAVALPQVPAGTTWTATPDIASLDVTDLGDGTLSVSAARSLSGVRLVSLTATLGGQTADAGLTVTVRPQAPSVSSYTPGTGLTTVVHWSASSTRSVNSYRLYAGGRLLLATRGTSATLPSTYGPASHLTVVAVGAQRVASATVASAYVVPAAGRAPVTATVLFTTSSWQLSASTRRTLATLVARARAGGFTHLTVVGHTDARGSSAYNLWLSHQRALSVRALLASTAGGVHVDLVWLGESDPVATNATVAGQALNRRVEVSLW